MRGHVAPGEKGPGEQGRRGAGRMTGGATGVAPGGLGEWNGDGRRGVGVHTVKLPRREGRDLMGLLTMPVDGDVRVPLESDRSL